MADHNANAPITGVPLRLLEETSKRLAATASELATVFHLVQDCTGVDLLQARKAVLIEIAAGLREHLRLYSVELGIGLGETAHAEGAEAEDLTPPAGGMAVETVLHLCIECARPPCVVFDNDCGYRFICRQCGRMAPYRISEDAAKRAWNHLMPHPPPLAVECPGLVLRSGQIQIDMTDMDAGSFPPEFRKRIGETRFRATLDVIVRRVATLHSWAPREAVRLVCSGRVTLKKDGEHDNEPGSEP